MHLVRVAELLGGHVPVTVKTEPVEVVASEVEVDTMVVP